MSASEVLEKAFAKMKAELCDEVAKLLPNPDKPFVVETDATIHALGALIPQCDGEEENPMPVYRQALIADQRN